MIKTKDLWEREKKTEKDKEKAGDKTFFQRE